jgi:hypothetical protein
VSDMGEVYNANLNRSMPQLVSKGRFMVSLRTKWGTGTSKSVDHLVAEHFVPGPIRTKGLHVHHVDEDLLNNEASNLVWKDVPEGGLGV